jgi:hypothetical protein
MRITHRGLRLVCPSRPPTIAKEAPLDIAMLAN